MFLLSIVAILLTIALVVWFSFNYWCLCRAAKIVSNEEFGELIRHGQLIDLRDSSEYRRKHILGARNIPSFQLNDSLGAVRPDKPILLYENSRAHRASKAAIFLKRHGYQEIYILRYGLDSWDGKVAGKDIA